MPGFPRCWPSRTPALHLTPGTSSMVRFAPPTVERQELALCQRRGGRLRPKVGRRPRVPPPALNATPRRADCGGRCGSPPLPGHPVLPALSHRPSSGESLVDGGSGTPEADAVLPSRAAYDMQDIPCSQGRDESLDLPPPDVREYSSPRDTVRLGIAVAEYLAAVHRGTGAEPQRSRLRVDLNPRRSVLCFRGRRPMHPHARDELKGILYARARGSPLDVPLPDGLCR